MRVVVDARKIADFGIGTYIRGLTGAAARVRPDLEILLLGPEELPDELVGAGNLRTVADDTARYGAGELLRSPKQLVELGADVFHAPHYTLPLRLAVPAVVTVHDCIHLRFPAQLPRPLGVLPRRLSWLYARLMLRHATRAAAAVVAVSEATRRDLVDRVGVAAESVHVIPNGCDPFFREAVDPEAVADLLSPLTLPRRFYLWVGNPKPHKNLPRLLQAWSRASRGHPEATLVLAGGVASEPGPAGPDRVRRLGPVPRATLRALYHSAEALVIPSLYEGFGLPALEAMACGTPVLAGDAGGLPEVVGDAGLLVGPESVEEIADALGRLLEDAELRRTLSSRGRQRAGRFRWRRAAEATIRLWQDADAGE